ncbi:MAG: response regulator [Verrucomicrobiales bacterium]|jgi:phosphate regulon transcriptional regulator PhoB|nr:DNA-binding response regulator [Pedosphaera sp.]MEC7200607.1 response regulator [Verrucomicrobiota bacterium]HCB99561.1 DNA-binding response regulator [Verrucomicrobiales bacterium]MEC7904591.1 response regulator [Verrucomicrobiota bacterium]MEC8720553.1 response regulator [Verrucomicrobiota bacterium]|tara:strand:- start:571 stop:1254 length:684 start_codon:yes stop_codon:yes gene_type:complete
MRILVVDDEPDAIELIRFNLKASGYEVLTAEDGEEALAKARKFSPDMILLDVMLPEIDGLEVCKILRRDPATASLPIIMLTAKASEIDRVLGLEFGADDYVTKPFSPRELMLRVRNLLKRKESSKEEVERFQVRDIELDVSKYEVKIMGQPIDLTPTEFKLLQILMERKGRVQSRDRLLQDVWGYDQLIDTRTVDTHVRRLREKMGEAADYVTTVRGVGYRLMEPAG